MEQISKYFNAEKRESLLFIFVGLIAMIVASYFLIKLRQPFYNGMAYPFIAVALIQLTVGCTVYLKSTKDEERVIQFMHSDQSKILTDEIPRMQTVMKNFTVYKWIEISLLIIGCTLLFIFAKESFWNGLGLGLCIQSGFLLWLDFFAENRGRAYLNHLMTIL